MAEVLSQSQIDALLNAARSGEMDLAASAEKTTEKKYRKYDFYSPRKFTKDRMKMISGIFENYTRVINSRINGLLHTTCEISVESVEEQRYYEFSNALTEGDVLVLADVQFAHNQQAEEQPVLLHFSTSLMLSMMDRLMGGEGDVDPALPAGYTVITPLTVMLTHLSETIKKHTYELLNRSETIQLVEHLKQTEPELVADAIPNVVSYANLEKILKSLLREGIPIKDLATILEAVVEASGGTRDIDMITEQVRSALSRTITRRFCENGQLRVVTLDAEVEKKVLAALTKNDHGVYLALSPDIMQQIIAQLGELRKKFNDLSQTPIVLTSQIIRVYLSRMIAQFYPDVYVLSFHEITSSVQIQAIGNITLQQQNQPS